MWCSFLELYILVVQLLELYIPVVQLLELYVPEMQLLEQYIPVVQLLEQYILVVQLRELYIPVVQLLEQMHQGSLKLLSPSDLTPPSQTPRFVINILNIMIQTLGISFFVNN